MGSGRTCLVCRDRGMVGLYAPPRPSQTSRGRPCPGDDACRVRAAAFVQGRGRSTAPRSVHRARPLAWRAFLRKAVGCFSLRACGSRRRAGICCIEIAKAAAQRDMAARWRPGRNPDPAAGALDQRCCGGASDRRGHGAVAAQVYGLWRCHRPERIGRSLRGAPS